MFPCQNHPVVRTSGSGHQNWTKNAGKTSTKQWGQREAGNQYLWEAEKLRKIPGDDTPGLFGAG
ncbi:hypothetical protein ASZ90_015978 [hydrocarbon metagenome]|uniref:Uncharacterized protein n=1 Tax=hydrocarbon metagenome TaxID=938273 RepID=A0A0W8F0M9_9ZZZZ